MANPLAMIIEDDPKLGDIFAMALRSADYETEIAADGDTALARLAEVAPALVLLDLHLPGSSGAYILRTIRADPRLAGARVILATADDRSAESLRREANMILLKPISPIQLRELASRLRRGVE